MKILGLIGGTSWVSTVDYYKLINQGINEKLGGLNYAECIIYSFNFEDIKKNNDANDWEATAQLFKKAGNHLKNSGAEALVFCAVTPHFIADRIETETGLPVLNIATATAKAIQKTGLKTVGLLGTKFTMELEFFKDKLKIQGISTIVPNDDDRAFIHSTIFDELGHGVFRRETKQRYLEIIDGLIKSGAGGIIMGCTEIPLLLSPEDIKIPSFDTLLLHSQLAVEFALNGIDN